MGFSWTNTITVSSVITAAALNEMRTNTDYIHDNPGCIADHATVNTALHTTDDTPHNTADNPSAGNICGGNNSPYDTTY